MSDFAFNPHTVILEKGKKGERSFPAEPEHRAKQRAESLADLHGAKTSKSGNTIRVHASDWYDK